MMNASRSVADSLASVLGFALMLAVTAAESDPAGPDVATLQTTKTLVPAEGRGHFKKMMLNPYMLIPQLIALGFAPIVLANLKMMVMSALMINNMALNAAIFMTIRNMVFGPRPKVKYVNHGYHNHRQGDGDRSHHYHDRQNEQQPPSLQHHTSLEGTQTATDWDHKRTDLAVAASLRRRTSPPLFKHRV
ncbi:uncharacterized protein LOC112593585 [Melanaphis sacchari]|uniref:uncharacterized protein LOC112593585 n=1 Tax=Melanaphis sacchari TaxID=742174 RepID=UPI000DC147C6|nr:uncharacterized protein LOC112593585 [Melanaphis sacchari]